jgi:hypothetical protein
MYLKIIYFTTSVSFEYIFSTSFFSVCFYRLFLFLAWFLFLFTVYSIFILFFFYISTCLSIFSSRLFLSSFTHIFEALKMRAVEITFRPPHGKSS